MSALKDEQSRLSAWKHELEATDEKVKVDVEAMERQRRQLNTDRQKLDKLAQQVRDKSAEIDDLVSVGCCTFGSLHRCRRLGVKGGPPEMPENIFQGKYHVKFGHLLIFRTYIFGQT